MFNVKNMPKILITLGLCLIILTYSLPAIAATKIPEKLQEQVLQIIKDNPQIIIDSVQAYQEKKQAEIESAKQKTQQAFSQKLKTDPETIVIDSPVQGAADAKIVLIEFSDFQCPFCGEMSKTIKQFIAKHPGEIKLVYKHFPLLAIHPQALPAARASWAANKQGKFWPYHDQLFSQQKDLGDDLYGKIAKKLNLDLVKFNSDRQSPESEGAIENDFNLGRSIGISGTPFFVMNDQVFSGALPLSKVEDIFAKVTGNSNN